MIALNLNDNKEWNTYVKSHLEPIQKLQKGKLCEDLTKEGNQSGTDSENNIFDHDFMTSVEDINTNDIKDLKFIEIEQSNNFVIEEEIEDHKKFF